MCNAERREVAAVTCQAVRLPTIHHLCCHRGVTLRRQTSVHLLQCRYCCCHCRRCCRSLDMDNWISAPAVQLLQCRCCCCHCRCCCCSLDMDNWISAPAVQQLQCSCCCCYCSLDLDKWINAPPSDSSDEELAATSSIFAPSADTGFVVVVV